MVSISPRIPLTISGAVTDRNVPIWSDENYGHLSHKGFILKCPPLFYPNVNAFHLRGDVDLQLNSLISLLPTNSSKNLYIFIRLYLFK